MSGRPLALGAGAGSLSSLIVALLGQHLQPAPSYEPQGVLGPSAGFEASFELPPIFWIGLSSWGSHRDPPLLAARPALPVQAVFVDRTSESVGYSESKGKQPYMRGGPSAVDLRDLEAAFARLSIRLEAAEARIALLEDQRNQARDYRSESPSGFSVVTAPPQRQAATSPQQVRTPAQEHPLQASAQPSAAPRERQELADHLGDWLRRELDGRGGGSIRA